MIESYNNLSSKRRISKYNYNNRDTNYPKTNNSLLRGSSLIDYSNSLNKTTIESKSGKITSRNYNS